MSLHTLYLCYFGLREPLVQTQVIPYLRELRKDTHKITLLTFEPNFSEKWTPAQIEREKAFLAEKGIAWHWLPYHKSPTVPATLYDVAAGTRFALKMIRENGVNVLHARAHVPALMAVWAKRLSRQKPRILFDIRGFIAEEYTDGGIWRENGGIYKAVKRTEKKLLVKSDAFVVLTEKAREILFPESAKNGLDKLNRPVAVIPCCVDLQKFEAANENSRRAIREKLNIQNRLVIVYAGSLGSWYLADEMTDLLAVARQRDQNIFALILTQSSPEIIKNKLLAKGFGESDFFVGQVAPVEMPLYLSAADIAISFIKACYSKLSSSPTKIAEYLAAGLPVIVNAGVGDVDETIETDCVGVVIENFNSETYERALREIENLRQTQDLATRCRQSAKQRFDLITVGGAKYRGLYNKLLNSQSKK